MSDPLDRICETQHEAYKACVVGYELAKLLLADGKRVRVRVEEHEDDLTARQRRFFHGPVLNQIAEQVRMPDGTRYVAAAWKVYLKRLFLGQGGYRFVMRKVPRWDAAAGRMVEPKRATPHREVISTEDLSVKQYSEFIDKVLAHAASELGVVFELDPIERDGVRYVSKRAARKAAEGATA